MAKDCNNRTKTAKIDMYIRFEYKEFGIIKDMYGNYFKLPYVDSARRKHKLKQLKPFYHTGYEVLNINQKLINTVKIQKQAVPVRYKMRFEMLKKNIPENYTTIIEK